MAASIVAVSSSPSSSSDSALSESVDDSSEAEEPYEEPYFSFTVKDRVLMLLTWLMEGKRRRRKMDERTYTLLVPPSLSCIRTLWRSAR